MCLVMMLLAAIDRPIIQLAGRFSNETQYAKGLFYDKENDPMRKQALDILRDRYVGKERPGY